MKVFTQTILIGAVLLLSTASFAITSKLVDGGSAGFRKCNASQIPLFSTSTTPSSIPEIEVRADFSVINDINTVVEERDTAKDDEGVVVFRDGKNPEHSIKAKVMAKGGYRFEECSVRPIKVKIAKDDKKELLESYPESLFKGLKSSMRFVTLCNPEPANPTWQARERRLVLKEFYIYKIRDIFQSTGLKVRLVRLKYFDKSGKEVLNDLGFVREPKSLMAQRCGLEREDESAGLFWDSKERALVWKRQDPVTKERVRYYPKFDQTSHFGIKLLNRLIRNDDYIPVRGHNVVRMTDPQSGYIYGAPYDFDISALVGGGEFSWNDSHRESAEKLPLWLDEQEEPLMVKRKQVGLFVLKQLEIKSLIEHSFLDEEGKEEMLEWLDSAVQYMQKWLKQ